MNNVTFTIIALTLVGCTSASETGARDQRMNSLRQAVHDAKQEATISCPSEPFCKNSFKLARIYVQNNASKKIRYADEFRIETYQPSDMLQIGMEVTKELTTENRSLIRLRVDCGDSDFMFERCAPRIIKIYKGFKPFVDSN